MECKSTQFAIPWGPYSFEQYQTNDKFERTISFYLSEAPTGQEKVPLVVYIGGSGGGSVFRRHADGSYYGTNYDTYLQPLNGRARLLLVEKPGVKLFDDNAGVAEGCSEEFLREHTLERWTEANNAAIAAAQTLIGIDCSKLLVIGHSEGGQVATHVAATNANVTHVASFATSGPTQLFDAIYNSYAKSQHDDGEKTSMTQNSTALVESVCRAWADIQSNKDSITKFWAGHPYRRWYSFCSSSRLEDLLRSSAKAYLVHGTNDSSAPVVGFDVLQAELLAHGRKFMAERIEGADHSLVIDFGKKEMVDLRPQVIARVISWFLD
jgi:pimeloyl-ACP methyl ester carboxylesterase